MQYLIIDWLEFIPALILLLTPGSLFYRTQKIRYRDISREWDEHRWRVLAHGLHAIDLARAALGTWLLIESLQTVPDARGLAKYAALLTQGGIHIFAVWVQTVACRHPDSCNAPFAFVIGLLLAGMAPLVALFSLALAIPIAMGARSPASFFPIVGVAHLAIGVLFKGKGALLTLGFGAVAAMIPLLWALMFRRELVVAYRARRMSGDHHPEPLR